MQTWQINKDFDKLSHATRADLIKNYAKELTHFGYDISKPNNIMVKLISYDKDGQKNFFVQFGDPAGDLPSLRINF